jgi:hypothetical protein
MNEQPIKRYKHPGLDFVFTGGDQEAVAASAPGESKVAGRSG